MDILRNFFRRRPRGSMLKFSTFMGIGLWGVEAFTAQPTLGSFGAHFLIAPIFIALLIWVAHYEGYNMGYGEGKVDALTNKK